MDSNDEVVGFADAGPGRDEDSPVAWELYSIYILGRAQGMGFGAALLGAAIGDSPAYLWVLEHNPRAQAIYRRAEAGLVDFDGHGRLPYMVRGHASGRRPCDDRKPGVRVPNAR